MTDLEFEQALEDRGYRDQVASRPANDPRRAFVPVYIVQIQNLDNTVNREQTLKQACYSEFTAEERKAMLQRT